MASEHYDYQDWYDETLKHAHRVEARANALTDELEGELEGQQDAILAEMGRLQTQYMRTDWQEETYTNKAAYLDAQRAAILAIIALAFSNMQIKVRDAAQDVMASTEKLSERLVSKTFPKPITDRITGITGITPPLVDIWQKTKTVEGLLLSECLDKLAHSTTDRIIVAGRQALEEGLTLRQTAKLVREKAVNASVHALSGMAESFLISADSYAQDECFTRMNEGTDFLKGWKYIAVLDGRTCAVCGADDGNFFKVKEERPRLPRHARCRCIYVPVCKGFDDGFSQRAAIKHNERLVHHRDGTTSTKYTIRDFSMTDENYSQWIQRQLHDDPEFVRSILGKTRFELFRDGKITLDKMVVDGRIKRLSELKL